MNTIAQHVDPGGFYFEMTVPGASKAELERGVQAAWDYFLASGIQPWEAELVVWELKRSVPFNPTQADLSMARAWTDAQHLAIDACCKGWPEIPLGWSLSLTPPSGWV